MARPLRGNGMRTYNSFNELYNIESITKKNVGVFNRVDCEMDRYGIWPHRPYLTCDVVFDNEPEYDGTYPIIYFSKQDSSMNIDELCNTVMQLVDGLKVDWDDDYLKLDCNSDSVICANRPLTEEEAEWLAKSLNDLYNE